MAGGGPVPIPTSDPNEKILSIADLEKAASKKLEKTARGKIESCVMFGFFLFFNRPGFFSRLNETIGNVYLQSIKQRGIRKISHVLYGSFQSRCESEGRH